MHVWINIGKLHSIKQCTPKEKIRYQQNISSHANATAILPDEVLDSVHHDSSKHWHLLNNLGTALVECLLLSVQESYAAEWRKGQQDMG